MRPNLLLAFAFAVSISAKDIPVADAAAFAEGAKSVAAGDTIILQDGPFLRLANNYFSSMSQ